MPAPLRAPEIRTALGWILLYFVLQAVGGSVVAVVLALVTGHLHSWRDLLDLAAVVRRTVAQPGAEAALVILVLSLAAAVVMLLIWRRWPRLWSLAELPGFGFTAPARLTFLLLAVAIGLAAPIVGGWLTDWLAQGHAVTQNVVELGQDTPLGWRIPLAIVVVSVGPLVEELLFRGVLLSALRQRWGVTAAVVLSSLAFALLHLPGLGWELFALPDLLLLALALAWLRLRSASIWPGVVAHAANNLLAVAAWFVVAHPGG